MKFYLIWVPGVFIYYIIFFWLSKKNNDDGGMWMWATYIFGGLCPFWIYVSRCSKNLIFDGFLYDMVMFFAFTITMVLLGAGEKFTNYQWAGVGMVVIGYLMMRS